MRLITSIIVLLIVNTNLNAQFFTKKVKGNGDIITKTRTISNFDKIAVAGTILTSAHKDKVFAAMEKKAAAEKQGGSFSQFLCSASC